MSDTNDIELKLDVLNQGDETYTSITDLYNVHIFTDSDMKASQIKKREESSYYKDISQNVFLDEKKETSSRIQDTLFLQSVSVSKKQELPERLSKVDMGSLIIGILVLVIFALSMVRYNIYRAVRRKRNADNSDFYQ